MHKRSGEPDKGAKEVYRKVKLLQNNHVNSLHWPS